jgi:hypothetical protein
MTRYFIITDFQPGISRAPMEEWTADEIHAHLDYYRVLMRELVASGELVETEILSVPDLAKVVTSDGNGTTTVLDGPFAEFKEWIAGYQIVDVESEARAIEIAARISAVPGEGGVPIQQPITVRRVMDQAPSDAAEVRAYFEHAGQPI